MAAGLAWRDKNAWRLRPLGLWNCGSAVSIIAAMKLHNVERALADAADGGHAFVSVDGDPRRGLILVCDHASNHLPAAYGDLGLDPSELERHIAYDIGAAAVTMALAEALGVPAVLSTFSRLLIDANRGEDDPTLIMRLSDGAVIPGNRHIDAAERAARIARFHQPYHAAIAEAIEAAFAVGTVPCLISMHSFTPVWRGRPRPWHVGILWDTDPRLAVPLIGRLDRADEPRRRRQRALYRRARQ